MAWVVFEKTVRRSTEPTITISKLGRFNFNGAATRILHDGGTESVLLMWDADTKMVGVRRVGKRDSRSYTVHYARKNAWAGFAAKTFLVHIGYDYSKTTSFPAKWDKTEEMFVFCLLPDSSKQEPQRVARTERSGIRKRNEAGGQLKASATS